MSMTLCNKQFSVSSWKCLQ